MNTTRPLRIAALVAAFAVVAGVTTLQDTATTVVLNDAISPSGVSTVPTGTADDADMTIPSATDTTVSASAPLTGGQDALGTQDNVPLLDAWMPQQPVAVLTAPLQVETTARARVRI